MTMKWTAAFLALLAACVFCASCGQRQSGAAPAAGLSSGPSSGTTASPEVEVTRITSQKLSTTVKLPAQLVPYEMVDVYPKVTGFVKWIKVDRGSRVKEGEQIAQLEAPELVAQRAEAESKYQSAESQLAAGQARLAADQATYQRMSAAARTPGVVALNDLDGAQKTVQSDEANVEALKKSAEAVKELCAVIGV